MLSSKFPTLLLRGEPKSVITIPRILFPTFQTQQEQIIDVDPIQRRSSHLVSSPPKKLLITSEERQVRVHTLFNLIKREEQQLPTRPSNKTDG